MPEAAFETADSLARKVGVSKAAVVRFGSKLGFGGFAGLHDAIAEGAMARLVERAAPPGAPRASLLDRWLSAASADLIATRRSVSDELLESRRPSCCGRPGAGRSSSGSASRPRSPSTRSSC